MARFEVEVSEVGAGLAGLIPLAVICLPIGLIVQVCMTTARYEAANASHTQVAIEHATQRALATAQTPRPKPESTPSPRDSQVTVANTGGAGVILRKSPRRDDYLVDRNWRVAEVEGGTLQVTGAAMTVNGENWLPVQHRFGHKGWVPEEYTRPA